MASNNGSLINQGSRKRSVARCDCSLCCTSSKNAAFWVSDPFVTSLKGITVLHPFSFLAFFQGISFNLVSLFLPFIFTLKFNGFLIL